MEIIKREKYRSSDRGVHQDNNMLRITLQCSIYEWNFIKKVLFKRHEGNFPDIYDSAKNYWNNEDLTPPINAVVRCENGTWIIESGMDPRGEGHLFECNLDEFHEYFYDKYNNEKFQINLSTMKAFLQSFKNASGDNEEIHIGKYFRIPTKLSDRDWLN